MTWTLARRAARLEPSTIREILKVTERPGIISLAGGLPSADGFPVAAMAEATAKVLRDTPREALQYAASEGYAPLREWVAAEMATHGVKADASQVLITTGSQQGLDLVGKVLIDPGCEVAVESPTYLGALQAFSPYEAEFVARSKATTKARCRPRWTRPRRALHVPAAQLPEPQRPLPVGAAPAGAGGQGAGHRPADRRGQPLRRPVVRPGAAAAADGHAG